MTQLSENDRELRAFTAALSTLSEAGSGQFEISDSQYDIEVLLADGQFWFGPRAAVGDMPVGLNAPANAQALEQALARIYRAESLARLLTSVVRKPSLLSPNPVEISVLVDPVGAEYLAPPGADVPPFEECSSAFERDTSAPRGLSPRADLKQCDQIAVAVQGRSPGARDVNRIHIDAKYCVHAEYERIQDDVAARQVGDGMIMCSDCPDGYSAGDERLFVVVSEARNNAEALNLEGLVENCGPVSAQTRGGNKARLIGFLRDLARRPGTRGSFGAMGAVDVWVERHDWRVLPKPQALARAGLPTAAEN